MSYEILYAKKFVKLSDGKLIPMVLSGSNNCTMFENGKEILERHWWVFGGLIAKTESEIAEWTKNCMGDRIDAEWWKSGSTWITGEDIFRFIKNSAKNASTIEEIKEANPFVSFSSYLSLYDSSKEWGEKGYETRELHSYFHTTEEIEEWLKKAREREGEWEKGKVYYHFEFSTIKPLKSNVVSKTLEGPVICSVKKGWYITDYKDNGYTYCGDIKQALVFENTEAFYATGLHKRINNNSRVNGYKLLSATLKEKEKEKNFYIKVTEGSRAGYFVRKLSSRSLYFSSSPEGAKKFEREKDALKYIEEKLKGRFSGAKEFAVRKVEEK